MRLGDNFDDHLTVHLAVHALVTWRMRKGNGCKQKKLTKASLYAEAIKKLVAVLAQWVTGHQSLIMRLSVKVQLVALWEAELVKQLVR
jgi:hypothetical protein